MPLVSKHRVFVTLGLTVAAWILYRRNGSIQDRELINWPTAFRLISETMGLRVEEWVMQTGEPMDVGTFENGVHIRISASRQWSLEGAHGGIQQLLDPQSRWKLGYPRLELISMEALPRLTERT